MILDKMDIVISFVIWAMIPGVKTGADFEDSICKDIFQRLGLVSVGFNVNGVVSRKIYIHAAWVMLSIILGAKKYTLNILELFVLT